jgi:zinc protease
MKNCFPRRQYRQLIFISAIFAIFLLLFSCAGGAKFASGGLGKASDTVPFMANARVGNLPSGIRYYLLENSQPEGRAFLTLAVKAGSVLETDEERGLAHFVEHMAFNGTARFGKSELINYLRSLGMRFGPEVNAYTSFDETVYGIEVPVETGPDGIKKIPDMALVVIDDWSYSVKFEPKDVDSERLVVMEEYRSRLGARERISRQTYPVLFRGSPYAERLPIGLPEVIENAPAEWLEGFYKKWYRPENMAVIIVGDFDAAFLETRLAEHFPARPRTGEKTFTRPRYNLSEPKKGSLTSLVLTDSELSRSRVDLYWKRKAEPLRQDLAYYREGIIDNLAATMLALRFEEAEAKSETPYAWAGAAAASYGYSSRYYIMAAQAKTASVKASLKELLLVKESLTRFGFTQEEAGIARAYLVSQMEQMVSEKDRQPSEAYVDAFTRHFLKGETIPDLEWELEAVKKMLPGITLKEINKTVKNYFSDDDLTVIISAPEAEKASLPGNNEIKTLALEIRKAKMPPPVVSKTQGDLLPKIPEPGTIVSEITDVETGALRLQLGNGAEVILKETKNKNSEISFYALARGGTLSVPPENDVSTFLAAEMLNASGLGPYSRPDLTKMLADKQVSLSFWAQNYLRGFQGSAAVKDIKTLFEMLHLSFTQPRLEIDAVKALLDQRRSNMAYQENDPNVVFRREITRTTYGNPRFHPLEAVDLDKANLDEAFTFIQTCLNPGDYSFVFTGNLDFPLFHFLIETYLASIPRSGTFNQWADIDSQRPGGVKREIRKGKEERSIVYMSWFNPSAYSDEKSTAVSALNEYLEIQLNDEIREVLGGVYSISSWVSLTPIPKGELSGGAYFVCDPKRAEELISAVKEEFLKVSRGNIEPDVFGKAVEALVKDHEQSIQSNLYIAQSYSNSAVIYRSPLSRLDSRPGLYRALDIKDIQRAASELLAGSNVQITLYPEI